MPFPQRLSETLFRASLYLLVIVISFTAMAIPVISRPTTPATAVPSKLTGKEIFDIVFALFIFGLIISCFVAVGWFPFPPWVVIDWLDATFRPMRDAVLAFRLRDLFRREADDVVDSDSARARAAPQTHGVEMSPIPTPTSSHQLPTQIVEPDALPTARRCASSATDDGGLTSPSSA